MIANTIIYRHYRKDTNPKGFAGFLSELRKRGIATLPNKKLKAVTTCEKLCATNRGIVRYTGISFCSRKDQFSRKEGRNRAELRANEAKTLNISFCTTKIENEDDIIRPSKKSSS